MGYLQPIVWSQLETIEGELKIKTPPRMDRPLEKWSVNKLGHTQICVTKDPPRGEEKLEGFVSLNQLCKDDGNLQLATYPLDAKNVQGLAIFGYTS